MARQVRAFWRPQLEVPVITPNEHWFNRARPRILLAVVQLCQQLAALKLSSNSPVVP